MPLHNGVAFFLAHQNPPILLSYFLHEGIAVLWMGLRLIIFGFWRIKQHHCAPRHLGGHSVARGNYTRCRLKRISNSPPGVYPEFDEREGLGWVLFLNSSFHFCLGTKVEQKAKSKTRRLLKQQNAEARHRSYFLMFRFAALKKWPYQHSYRCVLDEISENVLVCN